MNLNLHHIAGYFDAKGSVGIYFHGSGEYWYMRVQIMKKKDPSSNKYFIKLQRQFGGTLSIVTLPVGIFYSWQLTSKKAESFLGFILPYLKIKTDQVKKAVEWNKNKRYSLRYSNMLKRMKRI